MSVLIKCFLTSCLMLISSTALAHTDGAYLHAINHATLFIQGMLHPLTGIDHLIALFALGLLAYSLSRTNKLPSLAVNLITLVSLSLGMIFASTINSLVPHLVSTSSWLIESLILLSIPGFLFVALYPQKASSLIHSKMALASFISLFMLSHGWAHTAGFASATGSQYVAYMAGLLTSSMLLLSLSVISCKYLKLNLKSYA